MTPVRRTQPGPGPRGTVAGTAAACYLDRMQIRAATAQDIPAVLPMVTQTCALHEQWDPAKYGFLPNPAQRYERFLINRVKDPRAVFLVADAEPGVAAFLIARVEQEIPIYNISEYAFIHDVWVEPQFRHEGIARQLVMLSIERFKQMGVRQIRLDTAAANDAARSLFSSCGFRVSIIEMLIEL
jgi:ribosomal protein S18 acetylase RimI-like enzyme